jgi:uncharacterized membrane protein
MFIQRFLITVRKNFTAGVIFIIPIWVTILLIRALVNILADMFALLPAVLQPSSYISFAGAEILIALAVLLIVGFLVNNILGAKITEIGDGLISRIPVIRTVYQAVKHLTTGIVGDIKIFRQVVLVEYPIKGLRFIGFVTGEEVGSRKAEGEKVLKIFIPTTPNPTSGFFCYAEESSVSKLDITVEEAFKIVISAGYTDASA